MRFVPFFFFFFFFFFSYNLNRNSKRAKRTGKREVDEMYKMQETRDVHTSEWKMERGTQDAQDGDGD